MLGAVLIPLRGTWGANTKAHPHHQSQDASQARSGPSHHVSILLAAVEDRLPFLRAEAQAPISSTVGLPPDSCVLLPDLLQNS